MTHSNSHLIENIYLSEKVNIKLPSLGGLFHSGAFHRLVAGNDGRFFEWVQKDKVLASVHFTVQNNNKWRSPGRGTFAGYATSPELSLSELMAFHNEVEARLKSLGGTSVEVLLAPFAHAPVAMSNQMFALLSNGFRIAQCNLNQSLEVDGRSLVERMSYGNRKRLAKCEREGYVCSAVNLDALPQVYSTLAQNRESKGHTMSMTLAQLYEMAHKLPDSLELFACKTNDVIVASAICVRLDPKTLYIFYWGDLPGQSQFSPVVPLAACIYSHCQAQGISLLDAGTSTIDPEPNHGLLQFKRGLGFSESLKLNLEKAL